MITETVSRVTDNTDRFVNERIRQQTRDSIARCVSRGREAVDCRLAELDREWDVERVLETLSPSFTLAGLIMGLRSSRKWLVLPATVNAFLLQHALQGWCPPLPVLRNLGFRTANEIDRERYALKLLRGDFRGMPVVSGDGDGRVDQALAVVDF